jgi:hypothetical protein
VADRPVTLTLELKVTVAVPTNPVAETPVTGTTVERTTVTVPIAVVEDTPVTETLALTRTEGVPTDPVARPIVADPDPKGPTPHPRDLFHPSKATIALLVATDVPTAEVEATPVTLTVALIRVVTVGDPTDPVADKPVGETGVTTPVKGVPTAEVVAKPVTKAGVEKIQPVLFPPSVEAPPAYHVDPDPLAEDREMER